jgi:hypothetical protein
MRIDGPQITGSFNLNGDTVADLDIFTTTSSFNLMTASMATTASNIFIGTQTHSGSIVPSVNNTYDLGSPTHQFRHVYISTGSLYIDGTKVLGSTSSELQITTDVGQSFKVLETGADTITLQSNDGNVTLTSTGGGDIVMDPSTGVIGLKGTVTIYTGNKITSSDGNSIQFGNGISITGSIVATGTNLISGSSQVLNGSGVWSGSAQLPSGIISGSAQLPSGIVSSSSQVTSYGFSTTGSNNFQGTQTITGSLYISSDLIVQGSSSLQNITASAVNIGANIVNLNTANPAIRFAGLSVFDSGSIGGSGSFLYDAVEDEFIFIHRGDNNNITSSVVMMGPQTYNNVGNETYPTNNRILKGTGNEHIGDSIMVESGGGIGIGGNLSITGSIIATGTSLVSGSSQILNGSGIWSGSAQLPSGMISGSAQVDVMSTTNIARLATTGSNTFTSNQNVSGSVTSVGTGTSASVRINNTTSTTGRDWHLYSLNNGNFGLYNNTNEVYSYQITPAGDVTFNLSLTAQSGYFNKPFATNGTSLVVRQTTAGGNGNQDIGLVVDIQGANDLDRILNLRYYNGSTYTSRFSVLRDGKVGVGYLTPTVALQVSGTIASGDGDGGWGRFLYDSGTVKIQASKNGTDAIGLSFFTQASGGAFAERLSVSGAGTLQVKPNTIGTSDLNDRSIVIGSRPSSSTLASLGFDTGGTYKGSFDFNSSGGELSYWNHNGTSWIERWRTPIGGGFTTYGPISITEPGVSSFSISYSSGKTQFGMDSAGTDGFYFRSYSSGAYADRFIIKSSGEVNVRGAILPVSDATHNLGSTSLRWNNVYTTDLHLSNEGKQNVVDGTWGDWTLQEGENDIYMLNNRSGEKFKIKLEKIIE